MKKYFYIGLWGLFIFEILKVYFIMPFPGSQTMNSLGIAYFLHSWRWIFRIFFFVLFIVGIRQVFVKRKWLVILQILFVGFIVYVTNFVMTAESIFHQAEHLVFKPAAENKINENSLVIGVEYNGLAKAYPIQLLEYHHQVQDSLGGKRIMVTYCDVCRSGIVFEPIVDGRIEKFRLVGMDHFNAMFEDLTTKSWWRQSTGECAVGELKGARLPDFPSSQMTLKKWLSLHPQSLIMQPDQTFRQEYDTSLDFDYGKRSGGLTGTDSVSWEPKSWVIGIQMGDTSVAYDWNELKKSRIINDSISSRKIVIALSEDKMSFAVFYRPNAAKFTISHDTLFSQGTPFDFSGHDLVNTERSLRHVEAKQEFWHSWRQFHPNTIKK